MVAFNRRGAHLWCLLAFTAAVFLQAKCFRLGESGESSVSVWKFRKSSEPSQARSQGILDTGITFPFQLEADVQYQVKSRSDIATSFAFNLALKLSRERVMDDTVARHARRTPTCVVDLIQCSDEELVSVLLMVSG